MTHGKNICKQLKEVRKRIAEENNIPLEIEECTYKGECRGTCPRCEAEVRYLENALADRLRLGKVATVAGLALGLASTATPALAQTPIAPLPKQDDKNIQQTGCLRGMVIDAKTKQPIPLASVVVFKDSAQYAATVTDSAGMYKIHLSQGKYGIRVMDHGYKTFEREYVMVRSTGFTVLDVNMADTTDNSPVSPQMPIIQCGGIESGRKLTKEEIEAMPSPALEHIEIDGVKVIVR